MDGHDGGIAELSGIDRWQSHEPCQLVEAIMPTTMLQPAHKNGCASVARESCLRSFAAAPCLSDNSYRPVIMPKLENYTAEGRPTSLARQDDIVRRRLCRLAQIASLVTRLSGATVLRGLF